MMPKTHTIHLPGTGADDPKAQSALGATITNFYGTKLEGVTGFTLEADVGNPVLMATITLRVPVRIVYQDAPK